MGVENRDLGKLRIARVCQPHLNENAVSETRDIKDHLVIEPVDVTVPLSLFQDLLECGIPLGSHAIDHLLLDELRCQALEVGSLRTRLAPRSSHSTQPPSPSRSALQTRACSTESALKGTPRYHDSSPQEPSERYAPTCSKSSRRTEVF